MTTEKFKIDNGANYDPVDLYLHFKYDHKGNFVEETNDLGIFDINQVSVILYKNKRNVSMIGDAKNFDIAEKEIKLSGYNLEREVAKGLAALEN